MMRDKKAGNAVLLRRGRGRGKKSGSIHRFFIPRLWYSRVEAEGLTFIDRRITLHAERVQETADGILVYDAVWTSQGRGIRS